MHALFDWVKNHLGKIVATTFVVGVAIFGQQIQSAQAVGSCSFSCDVQPTEACTAGDGVIDPCARRCETICRGLEMSPTQGATSRCSLQTGSRGQCSACSCTPGVILRCEGDPRLGSGRNPGLNLECPNQCQNTCDSNRFRSRFSSLFISSVSCSRTNGGICIDNALVTGQLGICQQCVRSCIERSASVGSVGTPTICYSSCQTLENFEGGQNAPCQGINAEQAIAPFSSSGAVGGSSGSRSRIRSGTTAAANEAATLPPGACVQRAIAADAANVSLIAMSEETFGAASSTWTCRRVCSEQEQSGCVTGGCPGDASIRCCAPSLGIPPATQCGGRGAATPGAAADGGTATGTTEGGTTGGSTEGGASNSGTSESSGAAESGGGTRSSSVGGSSVAADSGGLTRLILPSCIEDGGCQFSDIVQVGLNLVRFLFGLAGVLLLVVFVYAGIEYLVAGDASSVKSAEDRIKKALLGLFFMFFGYTLVNFMVGLFVRA